MDADAIVAELRARGSARNVEGMARFGIRPAHALGVGMTTLRKLARGLPRDHALAAKLWKTGIHEARILATIVDVPERVTSSQMDRWARAFDSWDVCDQACINLFRRTPHAWARAKEWAAREREFEKRAGFALMATLAVHDKDAPDARFRALFPIIRRGAHDERNFVKKAVSWALRQIGKRGGALRRDAVTLARELTASDDKGARWVGRDALRELAPAPRRDSRS